MITVEGKGGIKATVIADSISEAGQRITTFELEYPRFIHAEFMTHRQFSRNAASSRAIPIEKMIEQVETNPAMPIHWGKNQSGMQAKEECNNPLPAFSRDGFGHLIGVDSDIELTAEQFWGMGANETVTRAQLFSAAGYHKQIVNRVLEPYQMIKVVCTATEYENFFYLRDHADAQPEIAELARCMREARDKSKPNKLGVGEWHLPYVRIENGPCGVYYTTHDQEVTLEDAIKISASLCAQVSYRKSDESLEKALKIYNQLVTMKPVHASPFEHMATPLTGKEDVHYTHTDKYGNDWSGNFKGWGQYRQGIDGHVYTGEQNNEQ